MSQSAAQAAAYRAKMLATPGNRLIDLRPDLAARAVRIPKHPDLDPALLRIRSNQTVSWRCQCGRLFDGTVDNAVRSQTYICAACRKVGKSRLEFEVAHLLRRMRVGTVLMHHSIEGKVVNLWLPHVGWAVELDPYVSHRDKAETDARLAAELLGVYPAVLRVREHPLPPAGDWVPVARRAPALAWASAIVERTLRRTPSLDEDAAKAALIAANEEWQTLLRTPPERSVAQDPLLAGEFVENLTHPGRTAQWTPPGSGNRCLWQCSLCGHRWEIDPAHRRAGSGCPGCGPARRGARQRAKKPAISALDMRPELADEFRGNLTHPERTLELAPPGVSDLCLWECSTCSHTWEAPLSNRARLGSGCAHCSRKRGSEHPGRQRAAARVEGNIELLRSFQTRAGHCRVPPDHQEQGKPLGEWVRSIRRKRSELTAMSRALLEAVPG
jgi:predicted  nucleic acid-binding Zn-ribbon protein